MLCSTNERDYKRGQNVDQKPQITNEILIFFFPLRGFDPIPGPGLHLRGYTIALIGHTTLGRTPLDEYPSRRRDRYLTTHNSH